MIESQDTFAKLEVRVLKRISVETAKHELPNLVESAYMRGYRAGMRNVLHRVPSMVGEVRADRSTTSPVQTDCPPPF